MRKTTSIKDSYLKEMKQLFKGTPGKKHCDFLEAKNRNMRMNKIIDDFLIRLKYQILFENGFYHPNEISVNEANLNLK